MMGPGGAAAPPHQQRIEHIMGMPIILDVHDHGVPPAALDRAFDWLRRVDARFSTYREDSEISRLNRGEIALPACSALVRTVLDRCERLRARTGGYFDHRTPDGALDPSGYVKGWAADGVAEILEQAGAANYCADAAGDMRLAGHPRDAGHWHVGIQHPHSPREIIAVLKTACRSSIATSATYARGEHIVDPHTGRPARGLASVTIIGEGDLGTADAYATAVFAMGAAGPAWAARHIDPYEALIVDDGGTVLSTPGLRRWRER
jgi:thiamine biosynthesis lipoprotein